MKNRVIGWVIEAVENYEDKYLDELVDIYNKIDISNINDLSKYNLSEAYRLATQVIVEPEEFLSLTIQTTQDTKDLEEYHSLVGEEDFNDDFIYSMLDYFPSETVLYWRHIMNLFTKIGY